MKKFLSLTFRIMCKYQTCLQKFTFQIGQKKFLGLKSTVPWTYIISDLEIVGMF